MPRPDMEAAEIVRRGEEIYDRDIRALVEAEHDGKFLVLDIESGDYEIGDDESDDRRPGEAPGRDSLPAPHRISRRLLLGRRVAAGVGRDRRFRRWAAGARDPAS